MKDKQYRLWYNTPAKVWTDALPLGNGNLGAMVFGGIENERLALNDDTLWSGSPGQNDYYANIYENGVYEKVMAFLEQGMYQEAHQLIQENWMGRVVNCYQPLGDLEIQFSHQGDLSDYERDLILDDGVCHVKYETGGVVFSREYFVSAVDNALCVRLTASQPQQINFHLQLTSQHPVEIAESDGGYFMLGQAPSQAIRYSFENLESFKGKRHKKYPEVFDETDELIEGIQQIEYEDGQGIRFAVGVRMKIENGACRIQDNEIVIEQADSVVLYLSSATNYAGFGELSIVGFEELKQELENRLSKFVEKGWAAVQADAMADHQRYFSRVSLLFDEENDFDYLSTDERIRRFDGSDDLNLISLFFQYGRYLMIAASRPGSQPLNLQGIWNEEILPPWASNYTLNINTEMNYWPAESCNLSEFTEPLFRLIHELSIKGQKVAEKNFALPGWTANHNTDLWRVANPVEGNPRHSFWPLAGGWLCEHLWEHYLFTKDRMFLEETAFPLMEGAVKFLNGWLKLDEDGFWVTKVGTSPENEFSYQDKDGNWHEAAMSSGPTMDIAIIRELFSNYLSACELLKIDSEFQQEIRDKLFLLLPYQVGKYEQLMEWKEDFEEPEPHHRHTSHLYGVYPGKQITPEDEKLIEAVKTTLIRRGDESTGWAKGWRICLWARLLDGNHAHKMISSLLTLVETDSENPNYHGGGGVYRNLFDAHPPFQIDGNFGATAGIVEMLLQSQNGEIHLLPALPDVWKSGSIRGLRARGGFEVDIAWRENKLVNAVIRSECGGACVVRYGDERIRLNIENGSTYTITAADFQTA